MEIVGYSFDADTYCVFHTLEAFKVETHRELENLTDSEGNEIHPIFSLTESGDSPTSCSICHEMIEDSWSPTAGEYAIEAIASYAAGQGGSAEVLDTWYEHLGTWSLDSNEEEALAEYAAKRIEETHEEDREASL